MEESLSKSVSLNLFGINYDITFPNTGQMMAIENEKNRMSEGRYSSYNNRFDDEGLIVKVLIDAFSTFSILCPQFYKDINVQSWRELPLDKSAEIVNQFTKVYMPWYNKWISKLSFFS